VRAGGRACIMPGVHLAIRTEVAIVIYYKYCSPRPHYFDLLKSCAIRATQPAALNDPFEMIGIPSQEELLDFATQKPDAIPGLLDVLRTSADTLVPLAQQHILQRNHAMIAHSGVICMSEAWDVPSMWAYYCDNHRGFVVAFSGDVGLFRFMRKVAYSDRLPSYGMEATEESVQQVVYTKSMSWVHEREHRVVGLLSECHDTGRDDPDGHRVYLHRFYPESIVEVIAGANMTEEHSGRLFSLAKSRGITMSQAKHGYGAGKMLRDSMQRS
jgi:hypothetical protein